MSDIINITELIKPIAGKKAVGEDLRDDVSASSIYYQVKDARNLARQIERKMQTGSLDDGDLPRWDMVLNLCVDILTNKTKDLEIAVWLVEALVRLAGFAGLALGFKLLTGLTSAYWDDIYPLPDEDGMETRITPLVWLNGDDADGILMQPIRNILITQGSSIGPFALWQYQQALANAALSDATVKAKRAEQGEAFIEDIQKAVAESTPSFYEQIQADLAICAEAYGELCSVLEEKCGALMPPTSQIKAELDNYADHLRFVIKDAPFVVLTPGSEVSENPASVESEVMQEQINGVGGDNNAMSRISALRELERIATFFKSTEPHSPIPYMLERAVRWGSMPFPELLRELINDDSARKNAFEMAGLDGN
ncbi:MAG: type VI secretion system protein TssA [Gammaproteobacteria bacterium]|nr:type VI secretion system protein TssA [Gammaproteobacteria bacterium]